MLTRLRRCFSTSKLDYEFYNPISKATTKNAGELDKTLVVLHGILGNHRNLRTVTHLLCNKLGDTQALLVTQRGHGKSYTGTAPHTVSSAAADVRELVDSLNLSPTIVMGHSFGGKVAAKLSNDYKLNNLFLLDSIPFINGISDSPDDSENVLNVLKVLKSIPQPIIATNQKEITEIFTKTYSLPYKIALWLTTSLKTTKVEGEKAYAFTFDVHVCQQLLDDFISLDVTPELERTNSMVLKAERNDAWSHFKSEMADLKSDVVEIKHAGHWLHTEQPEQVAQVLYSKITQ